MTLLKESHHEGWCSDTWNEGRMISHHCNAITIKEALDACDNTNVSEGIVVVACAISVDAHDDPFTPNSQGVEGIMDMLPEFSSFLISLVSGW